MRLITFVSLFWCLVHIAFGMNEKQVESAKKLVQNVCQPKFKLSDEIIQAMHDGTWPDDNKNLMCYMECCLKRLKLLNKEGNFDLDYALKQVPTLPPDYQKPSKASTNKCKDVGIGEEKCKKAYEIAKCIYLEDPQHYVLP